MSGSDPSVDQDETDSLPVITQEMAEMVRFTRLAYVATVNPDGSPNLSPKGSLVVVDEEHLAFANIASPTTVRNVQANGLVEINVLDPLLRKGYRFKGKATHSHDEELLELTAGGLGPEYPVDGVVLIEVTSASAVISPAYDCGGRTEDSVVAEFRSQYRW